MSAAVPDCPRALRRKRLDTLAAELGAKGLSEREQIVALAGAARELPPTPTASGLAAAELAFAFAWDALVDLPQLSAERVGELARDGRLSELPPTWRRRLLALVARKVAREIRGRA